jgi:hypothetical protein
MMQTPEPQQRLSGAFILDLYKLVNKQAGAEPLNQEAALKKLNKSYSRVITEMMLACALIHVRAKLI